MGIEVLIESLRDLYDVERGRLSANQVRRLQVANAVIDADELLLWLPGQCIRQLGLNPYPATHRLTDFCDLGVQRYDPVRLTIQGRECTTDVLEGPADMPVRIGRLPLLQLDFVIDPIKGELIGNPAHGGEQMHNL